MKVKSLKHYANYVEKWFGEQVGSDTKISIEKKRKSDLLYYFGLYTNFDQFMALIFTRN